MKNIINIRNKKGITIISLVVTIIILIIIGGVSINLLLGENGILNMSKNAQKTQDKVRLLEKLELLKGPILIDEHGVNLESYLEELDKVKDDYKVNYIEKESDINAYAVLEGKHKFLITDTEDGNVVITYEGITAELSLSETTGQLKYPETTTFEVAKNESGGELSVSSSNENIATASISGTTVTVKSGTLSGTATITVISAATEEYGMNKARYVVTVENGEITIETTTYSGTYDGQAHNAVTITKLEPSDTTVKYSLNGGEFTETIPQVTNAGEYSISIEASKSGYVTKTITNTIAKIDIVTSGEGNLVLSETSGTLTYPTTKTFTIDTNASNGTLSVTSSNDTIVKATLGADGKTVTITPQVITTDDQKVTITVKSAATANYEEQTATYEATVNRGQIELEATVYSGTYDGQAHNAVIITKLEPSDVTVKYTLKQGETIISTGTTIPTITNVGEYTVVIEASKAGYITKPLTKSYAKISAASLSSITLSPTSYTYDGTAKTPTATVKSGTTTLTNGTHYTLAYSNNTNVGTATVTATGKGNYTGTKSATFTIGAASLSSITLSPTSYTYDGTAKKPTATVKSGTTTLTSGTHYTLAYSNNTNVGTATVTATGKGNYTGTKSATFKINAAALSSITLSATSYNYDGTAKKPTATVKSGTKTLTSGTDYTLAYSNNTNVGTATVTATGKGNYTGTKSATFTIKDATKPQEPTITMSGSTSVTSLPATVKATVTHKDNEGGIQIASCKYILNTSSTALGTTASKYTGTFSSNGQQLSLSLSSATSYYLHILSVDKAGNARETVKGPIKVAAKYHTHTGSSSSNGGCYTTPVYKTGTCNVTFSCSTSQADENENYTCYGWVSHNGCGAATSMEWRNVGHAIGTGHADTKWTHTYTTTTISSYNLSCGKDTTTITGYTITY